MHTCQCGGAIKVLASIEDPAVIKQILEHIGKRDAQPQEVTGHKSHAS